MHLIFFSSFFLFKLTNQIMMCGVVSQFENLVLNFYLSVCFSLCTISKLASVELCCVCIRSSRTVALKYEIYFDLKDTWKCQHAIFFTLESFFLFFSSFSFFWFFFCTNKWRFLVCHFACNFNFLLVSLSLQFNKRKRRKKIRTCNDRNLIKTFFFFFFFLICF